VFDAIKLEIADMEVEPTVTARPKKGKGAKVKMELRNAEYT
jgi:hypothetical protein